MVCLHVRVHWSGMHTRMVLSRDCLSWQLGRRFLSKRLQTFNLWSLCEHIALCVTFPSDHQIPFWILDHLASWDNFWRLNFYLLRFTHLFDLTFFLCPICDCLPVLCTETIASIFLFLYQIEKILTFSKLFKVQVLRSNVIVNSTLKIAFFNTEAKGNYYLFWF